MKWTVSAPGSIMICGEHAVVHGHYSIVCAIKQRIVLYYTARTDDIIIIDSHLAHHETTLSALAMHPALQFVLTAIAYYPPSAGFSLIIESEIDTAYGLGSSAAVTVAMIALLARVRGEECSMLALHQRAHAVVLAIQGRGSGADIAASLLGGLLAYSQVPNVVIKPLPMPPQMVMLRYAGYKTPTKVVLQKLAQDANKNAKYYGMLYQEMGKITNVAIVSAQSRQWAVFYKALNAYQRWLVALGVCDTTQAAHVASALSMGAQAAKISGSGLGDCIVAFSNEMIPHHMPIEIAMDGVVWHD